MSVGVTKDYKPKVRNLHASHTPVPRGIFFCETFLFIFAAMSLREGGKEFLDEGGRGLEWLKNFDVFPKTVDDAKEVSVSGGSVLLFV
jgi:hypothetical protein